MGEYCIMLFYHGHRCGDIFVDTFVLDDVFDDNVWYGYSNGNLVCRFSDSEYNVVETEYGWEVNRVV